MPGGDGTGPAGMGPMTGRAVGYCAGFANPGYAAPIPGRGSGIGRGWGRGRGGGRGYGWRHGYYPTLVPPAPPAYGVAPRYAPYSTEQETRALQSEAEHLEGALEQVRKRIAELEAAPEKGG